MGELRDRVESDLQLRGHRPNTVSQYLRCIRAFVAFHRRPPTELGEDEVRRFLLHLHKRGLAASTVHVYHAAICFLYQQTLKRPEVVDDVPSPRARRPPPVVLTREEVRRILAEMESTFDLAYFTTMYACGLRSAETTRLQATDVDSGAG
ncbi:MAG: site-specific integrase, partial [Myxococcota bacterium]